MVRPQKKPLILRIVSRMAIGGVQNGIINTLTRADRDAFDYALLCTKKEGQWACRVRDLGIPVYCQKTMPAWDPYQIIRLARVIRRINPDLVHIHMAPLVIPVASAALLLGKPYVVQHHNNYTGHWAAQNEMLNRWEWWLTRRAKAIFTVAESASRATRRQLGLPDERVLTTPNGIDLGKFVNAKEVDPREEWGLSRATPVVVHVSRYLETKRIEDFIDAAGIIARQWPEGELPPAFVVIGDGPEHLKAGYSQRIRRLRDEIPSLNLWLEGGRHDLPAILPSANVGVLASQNEGCPNVILEYMAAGLPIAASNIDPIADIVDDGTHALLCPVCQPDQLAANILRLLREPELGRQLAANAREKVAGYDWQVTIRNYENIYRRVLGIPPLQTGAS